MLLVCKKHIKSGIRCLNIPHIAKIEDNKFQGRCVFCNNSATYKLFYSIPISKSHRISIQESLKQKMIL